MTQVHLVGKAGMRIMTICRSSSTLKLDGDVAIEYVQQTDGSVRPSETFNDSHKLRFSCDTQNP